MSEVLHVEAATITIGRSTVVSDLSLQIGRGEIVGLVGESGSGKSMTAMAILGLLPDGGALTARRFDLCGQSLLGLDETAWLGIRGSRVAYIPQEPMNALNPCLRVRDQLVTVIRTHHRVSKREALDQAREYLSAMLIHQPDRVLSSYPHQLSGGMRQRVLIAMAFSCQPTLLIADEPTTALDVTVQREVVEILRQGIERYDTAALFISHDLALVRQLTHRTGVLQSGNLVESGPTAEVIRSPGHPYTRRLIASLPETVAPRTPLLSGEADR